MEVAGGFMSSPGLHKRYSNSKEMLFYSECLELKGQKEERRKAWGMNRISDPEVKQRLKQAWCVALLHPWEGA